MFSPFVLNEAVSALLPPHPSSSAQPTEERARARGEAEEEKEGGCHFVL